LAILFFGSIAAATSVFPLVTGVSFGDFGAIDFFLEAFATAEPAVELADIGDADFKATAGTAFLEGSDFPWDFPWDFSRDFPADFEADLDPATLSTETLTTLPAGDGFEVF